MASAAMFREMAFYEILQNVSFHDSYMSQRSFDGERCICNSYDTLIVKFFFVKFDNYNQLQRVKCPKVQSFKTFIVTGCSSICFKSKAVYNFYSTLVLKQYKRHDPALDDYFHLKLLYCNSNLVQIESLSYYVLFDHNFDHFFQIL